MMIEGMEFLSLNIPSKGELGKRWSCLPVEQLKDHPIISYGKRNTEFTPDKPPPAHTKTNQSLNLEIYTCHQGAGVTISVLHKLQLGDKDITNINIHSTVLPVFEEPLYAKSHKLEQGLDDEDNSEDVVTVLQDLL